MTGRNRVAELIELAKEPSSQRRRDLLREITDLFLADTAYSLAEIALFDGVLSQLVVDMEMAVRAELAERFATSGTTPDGLARTLAFDAIEVARPILERSPALSQEDLIAVVRHRGQEHLRAVSIRRDLGEAVCDVIVERGDDATLGVLVRNETAALSREALEKVVDRAAENPALQVDVVERRDLPVDLLNEMYDLVGTQLRQHILQRNANLDPVVLETALAAGRKRVAANDGALPVDYPQAEAEVMAIVAKGGLNPTALATMLRTGDQTKFLVALSHAADIDFHTARRVIERREMDALAILCKASDFDRALFLTFAVLILDPAQGMRQAEEYGRLYNELSKETALRTLRFWRVRQSSDAIAA